MSLKYFGTDGIRGPVEGPLLSREFVQRVGVALGRFLRERHGSKPLHAVIGTDTRASGPSIALWVMEGLSVEGVRCFDAHVVPTPAVAHAVRELEVELGVAITASHNPATDNGIKCFAAGGLKFANDDEVRIEAIIDAVVLPEGIRPPATFVYDARRHYRQFALSRMSINALAGLTIAVDCAHGATYATTPEVLESLGAVVHVMGDRPDGANINAGVGSEHPEAVAALVRETGADLGLAHDGDGDRLVMLDRSGRPIDGDALLLLIGRALFARGELAHGTLVATVMSNLALDRAMQAAGGRVLRTGVGDRQVLAAMLEGGFSFGGEASGHCILARSLPTGDGLLTALEVLRVLRESGKDLGEAVADFRPFPQRLKNLRIERKVPFSELGGFEAFLDRTGAALGDRGRILVRYSGTENKIRLLVEAEDEALVNQTMAELEQEARKVLNVVEV